MKSCVLHIVLQNTQWNINLFFNLQPYRYYESRWLTMDGYDEYNNHAKQFKGVENILHFDWLLLVTAIFLATINFIKTFYYVSCRVAFLFKINQIVDRIYFPLRLILDINESRYDEVKRFICFQTNNLLIFYFLVDDFEALIDSCLKLQSHWAY